MHPTEAHFRLVVLAERQQALEGELYLILDAIEDRHQLVILEAVEQRMREAGQGLKVALCSSFPGLALELERSIERERKGDDDDDDE